MLSHLRRSMLVAFALALGASSIAASCHEDPARADALVCERAYSVCPNLAPSSADDITECSARLDGPCGTTMRQYLRCVAGKCDDAGAIDLGTASTDCGVILDAYRDCASTDAGQDASRRPDPDPIDLPDGSVSDAQES